MEEKSRVGIQPLDLNRYRRLISLISQDPALFQGRLRDNLDITGKLTEGEMISALLKVGLHDWANGEGLDFVIEERGRNVSSGEKQLICIARCLLQDTPLILMDEATSSIDPKSEELVMKASETFFQGRTQIIIAHRLSTIEKCDRLLWLHEGELKMMAKPSEVLAELKKFRDPIGNDLIHSTDTAT